MSSYIVNEIADTSDLNCAIGKADQQNIWLFIVDYIV